MDRAQFADVVRAACLAAARDAYEGAGVQGLCAEGRWEAALGAIERLDVHALARQSGTAAGPAAPEPNPEG